MQVTETKSEGLRREFKVVVPASEIEELMSARLQELSQRVSLPGFRPGKVPLRVIRQRYASSIMGDVLERALATSSNRAIAERELQPAGQPRIEITAFDQGRDLEYNLAFELMPKVEPVDVSGLTLERLEVEVTDADVEKALSDIAARHKRFAPADADRAAQPGDQLVIDFVGRVGGVAFEGGTAKDFRLELGASRFVRGFEDRLVGRKAGDRVAFDLTFPEDYGARHLAGKTAAFEVDVKEVRAPVPVAVDEELAKDLGLEDLAALRRALREQIEREYAALSRLRLKRALLDALAAAHHFDVPESLVEAEFRAIWEPYRAEELAARGHAHAREREHDHEHGHEHEHAGKPMPEGGELPPEEEEKLKAECRAMAERRVRLGLVLGEVGRRNNITVTSEELARAIQGEAMRFPGREKQVVEYYQKTPEALARVRAPLFEDKVVDFILGTAKVTARRVPASELLGEPEGEGARRQ